MAKQTDLRVVRTRHMLKEAFLELMGEIGLSKITVENLTKKAFVSRNTFYLHYTDKFDLLDKLENEVLGGLKEIVKHLPFDEMKANGFANDASISVIRRVFEYVKENSRFFLLIMSNNGSPAFMHKLGETIRSVMLYKNMEKKLKIPERYMIAVIVGIQTNIIGEWLRGGMKETPDELANIVTTVLKDAPKHLLGD
jgi:AcrR family transcriptional regulator